MVPCCTAQSYGGGIYPASEGTGRGECEVQRAFPRLGPGPEAAGRSPRAGSPSARAAEDGCGEQPARTAGGHSPLRGDRGQGVDKPPLSPGRRGGHNAVMSSEDSANPHVA